jgi:imidazolonepropionase-like amidohydrolase
MLRGLAVPALVVAIGLAADSHVTAVPATQSLALFLLGHRIGVETSTLDADRLVSHFEYVDRGTTVALDTTLTFTPDVTPLSFESHGKSYRYFGVDVSVPKASGAPATFTLDGMAPIAAQGLLIRYWLAHGRPDRITLEPSGDVVHIVDRSGPAPVAGSAPLLRQFSIDGVVWGREELWLDTGDMHVAAALTTAGVLAFEAYDARLAPRADAWRRAQTPMTLGGVQYDQHALKPRAAADFALTGGRVVDATGAPPIENATVLVRGGRIARVGPRGAVTVPRGVPVVDVSGQTVLPGLWDMHAHVGQPEWGPVYLASGVTTARDMGGEFDIVTALRDAWARGPEPPPMTRPVRNVLPPAYLLGPRLLLAGLVDGPGPASFGHITAANPDEGRAVVQKYKAAGFQQMKLYNLLDKPTVAAVIEAAHAGGMTVTGHIPNGLTMREVVEMGMDHVAHLTVRDTPGTDAMRETIAFLKAHGTVIDPTVSWNELLGRSPQTPIESFQPGFSHVAPPLQRLIAGASGGQVTPQQAHERLARSLSIIKALHDGGVPIVAGTDKGVPGVSVAREVELYVEAGLTPMDAIRAATAVPARVMGLDKDSGTIAPGLRADLIVVDGNPLERIADVRNVRLVSANGRLYDAGGLWLLGGFR